MNTQTWESLANQLARTGNVQRICKEYTKLDRKGRKINIQMCRGNEFILGMVASACNLSTWEGEGTEYPGGDQPGLYSKTLFFIRDIQKSYYQR
jgi:hypothetical protein